MTLSPQNVKHKSNLSILPTQFFIPYISDDPAFTQNMVYLILQSMF
jgi:hypothetical protein